MDKQPKLLDSPIQRNDEWLAERLATIWYRHFPDIAQPNEVIINFGRKSRTRLGSIGMTGWQPLGSRAAYNSRHREIGVSVITITGYFKDERVPEYVVDATIGHELVHYAHGFHSPHPQLYEHPHKDGVVDKEMKRRGLGDILKQQKVWLRQEWKNIIGPVKRRVRRRRVRLSFLPAYKAAKT